MARLSRALTSAGMGAVIAQVWQAVGSFGLQLLAAWLLGASGLGLFSVCLSIIILVTAIVSGMVGDSLVVLDRHDPRIRGGLQFWALVVSGVAFVAVVVAFTAGGVLALGQALLLAAALVAFSLEEVVRRVFMATLRFWRLVIIDTTAVVVALVTIAVATAVGPVQLQTFFLALLLGQLAGIVVGVVMLPPGERVLVSLRGAAVLRVLKFGGWRGLQVSVAPTVLTGMRLIVAAAVGSAVLGGIELARIYAAPALLAVQGFGSYLLSTYVKDKGQSMLALRQRAWRASAAMMGAVVVAGAVLIAVAPLVAPIVSGPHVLVDRFTMAGWVLYVIASASVQPFASLAAARGRPALVLRCRIIDAALVLAALAVLLGLGTSATWTPYVLAAGLFIGGFLVRQFALNPLVRRDTTPLGQSTDLLSSGTTHASR